MGMFTEGFDNERDELTEKLNKAKELLTDYHNIFKSDYSKQYNKFDNVGLYMQDLSNALGGNAAKEVEKIYFKVEEFLV